MRRAIAGAAAVSLLVAGAAAAASVDGTLFAFPGSFTSPATAPSAAAALCDRWLGDRPFDNPAFSARREIELSPALVRVSRQDLRADNRNFDDQGASIDAAGGWLGLPIGRAMVFAYANQPLLRLEGNAYTRGVVAADPQNPPATIESETDSREFRAGGGASWAWPALRIGVAGEWTRRDDHYQESETSGSPTAGTATTDFSGEGFGVQAGARLERGKDGRHPLALGFGVRYLPELSLDGEGSFDFSGPVPDSTATFTVSREAGWEAGLTARLGLGPTFAILTGVGRRSEQAWTGLDATSGAMVSWGLGGEYQDPEEPWQFRFGFGLEQQSHVPEPRAFLVGLGLGWASEGMRLDIAGLRRTISRGDSPHSFDDRVVASLRVSL